METSTEYHGKNNWIIDDKKVLSEGNDEQIFYEMLDEIESKYPYYNNRRNFINFQMAIGKGGAGNVIAKYIDKFENEYLKAEMLYRFTVDKVPGRDRLVMDLYHKFRASKYYLVAEVPSATFEIYHRYDNSFYKIKSKKLVPELIEFAKSIAETRRLAITYGMMMKKWAPPEMEEIMAAHLLNRTPTKAEMGFEDIPDNDRLYHFETTQSRFTQIEALSYFPSERNRDLILTYADHEHKELSKFAKKTAEKMDAKLLEIKEKTEEMHDTNRTN